MKLTEEQKQMINEAIRVHDEEVKFALRLADKYHVAVTASDNVLIEQLQIILR